METLRITRKKGNKNTQKMKEKKFQQTLRQTRK